jgi:hypothetical protein
MTPTVTRRPRFGMTFERENSPYPMPPAGAPLRLAFVGQSTFFVATSLDEDSPRIKTRFFEFRRHADPEPLIAGLREFDPHVVIVFRPELIPDGLFADLRAATLGFMTEPLPRMGRDNPNLQQRMREMQEIDRANFDRIVAFDPLLSESTEKLVDIWRTLPLPVADRYYMPVRPMTAAPRIVFVGRSTEHREAYLLEPKHQLDILHLAFGVDADMLEQVLADHDVTINLHNEDYESFENRVCLHLAAGHLVISEKLNPRHGLEPGIDYIEVNSPEELMEVLLPLQRWPGTHDRIRERGWLKAEQFRASAVYPRLVNDLLLDLRAFGTERGAAG